MKKSAYLDRPAFSLENEILRVTVMAHGGHIAEIFHKPSQVNPLWRPVWPSMDPPQWTKACELVYGRESEGRMLSSVTGHFLCLDTFGMTSPAEQVAGAVCHGNALLAHCAIAGKESELACEWSLDEIGLRMTRKLVLAESFCVLRIVESVENLSLRDYPVAWTQYVTLETPFLERGVTQFRIPDVRSMSLEGVESGPAQTSTFTSSEVSGGFAAHKLDPAQEHGFFAAYWPAHHILHGYVWKRTDFPWIGIWEENHLRQQSPWNGKVLARGMEFGVSPFPESRRDMIMRGELFGTPCCRWIPAKSAATVEYCAFLCESNGLPNDVVWDNWRTVSFNF